MWEKLFVQIVGGLIITAIVGGIPYLYRRKKKADDAAHLQSLADEHPSPQPHATTTPEKPAANFREGYTKFMAWVGCVVMGLVATILIDMNRQYWWAHVLGWIVFSAIWVGYSEAVVDHEAPPPLTKSPRKDRIIMAIMCVIIWAIPSVIVLYFAKDPQQENRIAATKMMEDRRREAEKHFEEARQHLANTDRILREQEQTLKVLIHLLNGTATEQEVKEAMDLINARGLMTTAPTTAQAVKQKH